VVLIRSIYNDLYELVHGHTIGKDGHDHLCEKKADPRLRRVIKPVLESISSMVLR
jgi:hypothetical protein